MNNTPFSLTGKKAIVTGGATGLGYGIAEQMVAAGAEVCLISRNEDNLRDACSKLGPKAHYHVADLDNLNELPEIVSTLSKDRGVHDILVNNAGRHLKKWSLDTSDDEFQALMQTNLNSVFALSREAGKQMVQNGGGSIIMISSMAGIFGIDQVAAYSASKTAMLGLTRTMAVEYASKGLRINAIAPGWIYSNMSSKALDADPGRKAKVLGRIPSGEMGQPSDIGLAVVYLASEAGKYVNGVVLPVDGGAAIGF